jgi:hypothetical protein
VPITVRRIPLGRPGCALHASTAAGAPGATPPSDVRWKLAMTGVFFGVKSNATGRLETLGSAFGALSGRLRKESCATWTYRTRAFPFSSFLKSV